MKTYYFPLLLFLMLSFSVLSAQPVETKNGPQLIKVVVLLKYKDSTCVTCDEVLKQKLKTIQGAWNVKIFKKKKIVTFYVCSDQIIRKRKLSSLIKQAGFIPLQIEYISQELEEKDELEEIDYQ